MVTLSLSRHAIHFNMMHTTHFPVLIIWVVSSISFLLRSNFTFDGNWIMQSTQMEECAEYVEERRHPAGQRAHHPAAWPPLPAAEQPRSSDETTPDQNYGRNGRKLKSSQGQPGSCQGHI